MSGLPMSDEIRATESPVAHLLSGPPACDVIQGYPISTLPPGVKRSTIYLFDQGAIQPKVRSPQQTFSTPTSSVGNYFFFVFSFFSQYSHHLWIRVKMADPTLFQSTPSLIMCPHPSFGLSSLIEINNASWSFAVQ